MSSPTPSTQAGSGPSSTEPQVVRATAEAIDASCRWPVMFLFACGVMWLVIGGLLATLASVKLHAPGLLAHCPWLTYGRVQPAAWNVLVYGFATQVALGGALWLTARLSGVELLGGRGIMLATLFWNGGLKLGVLGILAGQSTGLEGLELPAYVTPILFISYVAIAVWGVLTFRQRRVREVYVSQWYLLGALFGFPWILAAGNVMGVFLPLRGVLQASVQAWFVQNLFNLWLGFIALAVLYYLLPKLVGRPLPSRNLALFGFWTLALFGSLGGMVRYQGGPFPAWMTSVSVVATVLALFGFIAVALNLWPLQARGGAPEVAFRFGRAALVAYLVGGGLAAANAFTLSRRFTQFTLVTPALDQLFLLGFVGLALIGLLYHAVPLLTGQPWPFSRLLGIHWVCAVGGVVLLTGAYGIGGLLQGSALDDAAVPFASVFKRCVPFIGTGSLAHLCFLAGSVALAANLAALLGGCARRCGLPAAKSLLGPVAAEVRA